MRLVSRAPRQPRRSREFHHRLLTACGGTHAPSSPGGGLERRCIPAEPRRFARRSALRFGRNTLGPVLPVGAPPSRALSAGPPPGELAPPGELGLTALGAHASSTTGCQSWNQRRGRLALLADPRGAGRFPALDITDEEALEHPGAEVTVMGALDDATGAIEVTSIKASSRRIARPRPFTTGPAGERRTR